jgi:hypothetical protein
MAQVATYISYHIQLFKIQTFKGDHLNIYSADYVVLVQGMKAVKSCLVLFGLFDSVLIVITCL